MNKILFLDHDGVICLADQWGSRSKKKLSNKFTQIDQKFDNFDKKAIKILNQIIQETDCEIVVSSDWKYHATLEEMQEYYKLHGIIKSPIGYTKCIAELNQNDIQHLYDLSRCFEINEYVNTHQPDSWVAVDDLDLSMNKHGQSGLSNFVLTPKSNEGIKQSGIKEKIIKFLNHETY